MKRFVLTGGHGVGKSSIILALEQAGEHVIFEAAASIRAADRAHGSPFPDDHDDFESRALRLHLRRERLIPGSAQRVFLDRGAPDHLAYAQVGRWTLTAQEEAACRSAHYDAAYLVEPPPDGVPTLGRVEARFCERLVTALERVYRDTGTPIVHVPHVACHDRCLFVLHHAATDGCATATDLPAVPGRRTTLAGPLPATTTQSGTTPLRRTKP
ncbi:MAG: ATP-binding protein [Actinobacteria bacterium]|nr:ATP-binding protein [Actinomycetota bacterium]